VSARMARRRKPSAAARLRPFWVLLLLALVAGAAIGYAFVEAPAFRPSQIAIEGNHVVSRAEILERARVDSETNVWLQNTGAMRSRIAQIPRIGEVRVRRIPPAQLEIAVTERVPFAIVRSGRDEAVVDRTLRVLSPAPADSADRFPVLAGPSSIALRPGLFLTQHELSALRDDQIALASAHLDLATLAHDRFGGLVVTLRNGVRVLFGDESDLSRKTPLVEPILRQVARKSRPMKAIDLRAPGTPVVDYE
jgi:cell division protein FtsQ